MDLSLDDDQLAVQEAFSDFFAKESPIQIVRGSEPLGFSAELWRKVTTLGAPGMSAPESLGGGGSDSLTLCLVAEQLGRRLAPVPLIESLVAADVLAQAGATEILSEVVGGSSIGTIALDPARDGVLRLVPAGAVADTVVALDGDQLVALGRDTPPPAEPNFGSSPLANWTVEGSQRTLLASGPPALGLHSAARALWKLLMSAALNGIQSAALEIAVDYVKNREAFGRPIAWFQTIQHRLADVAVAGDGARYLTYEAACARDRNPASAAQLAAMAFLFSAETSFFTCRESLQFHGGYGYTLEYDIQLFYRRAKAWPLALGDPRLELRHVAECTYGDGREN